MLLLKWRIHGYICSCWCSILNITMMIVLVFFSYLSCRANELFSHIGLKISRKTKFININNTILRILSFLGDSSSISSILDENTEDVWETENVTLLVANAVLQWYYHFDHVYSNCHFLILYLQLINQFQYLYTMYKLFSHP